MNPLPEIQVRTLFEPTPKKPVLVCGLPGSGYVGKLAADYLVDAFKARKCMEFRSPSFPPHVNVNDEGTAQALRAELFFGETGQGSDLLIFTADSQPTTSSGEYELSESVLRSAKGMGAGAVFSLAAYITGNFVRERKVFGTATSLDLLARLTESGVQVMREGGISGMNGIVVGMAKLEGMDGISLLGETSGYLVDPVAAHAVLEALGKILGLKIDLENLLERAKEAQQVIGQIQRMGGQEIEESRGRSETRPDYIG